MRTVSLLSVVVPCHNEEQVLPSTHNRLNDILKGLVDGKKCEEYEILYVDNGSTDGTLHVLQKIFEMNTYVRVIALRCNFGYQGSISAGLFHADGDAVVTIDADLQDPPEKIEEMMAYYNEGYDLVLGVRKNRSTDSWLKRFFSENYYRLLKGMGVDVVYNHGDFRLMSQSLVKAFNAMTERNRLIRAMILKLESRYALVQYDRAFRREGRSKFNAPALFSLAFDGITSFSYVPLRIASFCGILMCLTTLVGIGWVLYIKTFTHVIPGWASTLLPIFALSGFQLFVLGILGEYIGKLYMEVKQRPVFLVRSECSHRKSREHNEDIRGKDR
ncbi:MAG TPA: glycosyltransferase [Candidatus Omnitrophica bacterium]|nr:MAG: hypothetical protein A2Z81_09840 [Omnitrophica WOR_2 bacterium GWA2_45_18]OGX19882.1 MAG: hypothetical protein A2Y04_02465 [Omnitrophica WOR_2 bacterium GWC2_45_7]HBR15948.1 glycosyltransferase [Candidatus Omnitrophota bacterium]